MCAVIGKAEGEKNQWHGHVTAVTVAPEFRRLGLAKYLMDYLERVSDQQYHAYFVDLYVRASNAVAIEMYEKLGYKPYRQVVEYYMGEEDALGTAVSARCMGWLHEGMSSWLLTIC